MQKIADIRAREPDVRGQLDRAWRVMAAIRDIASVDGRFSPEKRTLARLRRRSRRHRAPPRSSGGRRPLNQIVRIEGIEFT